MNGGLGFMFIMGMIVGYTLSLISFDDDDGEW